VAKTDKAGSVGVPLKNDKKVSGAGCLFRESLVSLSSEEK